MHGPDGLQRGAPDPVLLEGPPTPSDFATITIPDSGQSARYRSLYANLMGTTQSDRDSLQATRTAMREARESQDHESMRRSAIAAQELVASLKSSQQAFDDALKAMLSGHQFERYEGWRRQRRKQEEEQMKQSIQSRSGEPATP